jgi:hypothetical protein
MHKILKINGHIVLTPGVKDKAKQIKQMNTLFPNKYHTLSREEFTTLISTRKDIFNKPIISKLSRTDNKSGKHLMHIICMRFSKR